MPKFGGRFSRNLEVKEKNFKKHKERFDEASSTQDKTFKLPVSKSTKVPTYNMFSSNSTNPFAEETKKEESKYEEPSESEVKD